MIKIIQIKLNNVKEFKNILTVAETILTEIKLELDNDGLRFRGLDGGHSSFFEADFKKDYFLSFELSDIDNIIVDSSELNKVLKRVKNDDDTSVIIDKDVLTIRIESDNNEKIFQLYGIDMEYHNDELPNIEYPINVNVDFKQFKDNVIDAGLYENKLRIKTEDDNLIIYNKGLIGSYESKLKMGKQYKPVSSVFSMELINKLFKLNALSNNLNISIGTDYPILFKLNDNFEDVFIKLMIAPIIEEDY